MYSQLTPTGYVSLYTDDWQGAFNEACIWEDWTVIGYGSSVYFANRTSGQSKKAPLNGYFGHLYPYPEFILVASASQLHKFSPNADLVWTTSSLGIDGVAVHQVKDGQIYGEGEWDPPGAWKEFHLILENGAKL